MFLWTVILLVVGSYQDIRLQKAVFVSDEVCGYLRHIDSNTCVGANVDQHLIADETSPCSEPHLFCVNTTTQIIRQQSSQSKVALVADSSGNTLKLMTNNRATNDTYYKWRLQESGKIQQATSGGECWQHNEGEGLITIATCNTPGNQQFDFQKQRESESSGNLLLFRVEFFSDCLSSLSKMCSSWRKKLCKSYFLTYSRLIVMIQIDHTLRSGEYSELTRDDNYLKIQIQEKNYREEDSLDQYRFHIIVNFFDSLNPGNSLGILKLQIRHLEEDKKEMFLTAINWETSKRCSTAGNTVKTVGEKINSELLVRINGAGQINVVLDGEQADLECWTRPWSDPVKIRVTGLDMRGWNSENEEKLDDLFEIRYDIQHQEKRKFCI